MPNALPNDGETVGLGQPIAIRFDEHNTNRDAPQQVITMTTNPPDAGASSLLSNREAHRRPAH